ncbi:heme peroxidase [Melanogaster broomeanus]|nr:heme peroxidase [Melanogaster broomeanus]
MSAISRTFSSRFSSKSQASVPSSPIVENGAPSFLESGTNKAVTAIKDLMKRASDDVNESALSAALDAVEHAGAIDDRKMLLENILSFMANHPTGKIQDLAQTFVIKQLYNDLAHPPATFMGPEYAFRTADGSNNNPDFPDLGKAGTPYSRSVQQGNALPRNQMPDAGLVFDTLLRRDEFRKHPAGLSSLMFSFAALVIHSVFRTDHKNVNINMTSGYVDLAPLYGNDQATQDKIRIKDGRGCLHPDTFAEDRLLLLPPATAYIARRLLEINERGTWVVDPSTLPPNSHKLIKQEEEIFQIARLCNCAWFAAVIFSDYFSAILGLVRQGSSWSLAPFGEIRDSDHSLFERGRGNACSIEFNSLYRWHATTSLEDEETIKAEFAKMFPNKDPQDLTLQDFYQTEARVEAAQPPPDAWTFSGLTRQDDKSFKDSDLANILQNSTSHHAAAFGARGTPAIMRVNEIMGIESNRTWGVCSLNDFRKFLGLKTYTTFLEWNPNPEVADAAEKLYGHIDNLELYVGLQAEDTKPVIEGAGLCPGYTISRAILSDAIALTRGDRFFTEDFTPYNMTAWGFADCQRDPNGWGFGSTLGRLFLRTLPNDYDEKSVYTWFPLMHPEAMETNLKNLGKLGDYSLTRPIKSIPPTTVKSYVEVGEVLRDSVDFTPESEVRAKEVIEGKGFFSASGDADKAKEFLGALAPPEAIDKIGQYFYKKTSELIGASSCPLIGQNTKTLNVVHDVLRLVPIYWACDPKLPGITLKDKQHPHGVYTPQELYDILGEIYQFIFLDVEPAKYLVSKQKVKGYVEELSHHIKNSFGGIGNRLSIAGIFGTIFGRKKGEHNELLKRLFELGHSNDEVVNEILALLVGVTVEVSLALTNVVNLLLDADKHAAIRTQAKSADAKDLSALEAYVIEALRIDPPFAGVYRVAKKDAAVGSLVVTQGERLFLDVAGACMNEQAFPNPTAFDPTRKPASYLHADVAHKVIGLDLAPKVIAQVLRGILCFDNVRRAPGPSGTLTRFKDASMAHLRYTYLNAQHLRSPWPTTMLILYDVPASTA